MRLFTALTLSVLVLAGCKRRSGVEDGAGLPPKRTVERLLKDIDASLYTPQRAEMKGDVYVDSGDFGNLKLSGTFRTAAGEAFWMSLRKFGFEGARALITPDSVVALNRLQREVLVASASDIPAWAMKLPIQPTLANLQAAFGGQPIGEWTDAKLERQPGAYTLALPGNEATSLEVAAAANTLPQRWSYREGERFGEVVFSDFRAEDGRRVYPYTRSLVYSDTPGDTTRVRIVLESITEKDDLSFPISVPKGYSPMDF